LARWVNLAAFWQQIVPIVPFLPVTPVRKYCAVYNLRSAALHGMEEVVGSIPTRSTNKLNHLEASPFLDFVAFLSEVFDPFHSSRLCFVLCLAPVNLMRNAHGGCCGVLRGRIV
jgi:hypothetical protein